MANIDNLEVIRFSDNTLRIYAGKIAAGYYAAKALIDRWNAQDMSNKITNNSNDFIVDAAYGTDGTDGDGRPIVNGANAYNVYTRASDLVTDMEANSNAKLNTILAYAVSSEG